MAQTVAAVVVTFNRLDDLRRCLDALEGQTRRPDAVLVVDNASTDGTAEHLAGRHGVESLRLAENSGGAGGFAAGVEAALARDVDWVWLMDDDCLPEPGCLAGLLARAAEEPQGTGGAIPALDYGDGRVEAGALRGRRAEGGRGGSPNRVGPDGRARSPDADSGAFLGVLLRAAACRQVGLPRADFFIWHDDTEYLLRIRRAGWRLLAAPQARVHHPTEPTVSRRLLGRERSVLGVPPWKEYYDARNLATVQRVHRGSDLVYAGSPGRRLVDGLVRTAAILAVDPRGAERVAMRIAGRLDAARGRMGKRVRPGATVPWRARP